MLEHSDSPVDDASRKMEMANAEIRSAKAKWMIRYLRNMNRVIPMNGCFGKLTALRQKEYQLTTGPNRRKKRETETVVDLIAYQRLDIPSEMVKRALIVVDREVGRAKEMMRLDLENKISCC